MQPADLTGSLHVFIHTLSHHNSRGLAFLGFVFCLLLMGVEAVNITDVSMCQANL